MISSLITQLSQVLTHFAAPCAGGTFLGFPKWYKYLNGHTIAEGMPGGGSCAPKLEHLNDVWLIVAAVVEILLRLGGILAIVYVIYGGVQYIVSQGDPGKVTQAKSTVVNALIGLVISIGATVMVTFVAGRFT